MKKVKLAIGLVSLAIPYLSGCMTRFDPNSESGKNQIVFVSSRSGANDIYSADVWGKNVRALTSDVTNDASPHIMKDGRVVFSSKRTGTWQIYTMDWDGSHVQAITQDRAINNYRPSPSDDGRIVFVSDRFLKPQIFSISADGSDLKQLTQGDDYNDYPVVTPDGQIYFTSSRAGKWEVWRMLADGGKPAQVTMRSNNIIDVAVLPPNTDDTQKQYTNRTMMLPFNGFYTQSKVVFTERMPDGSMDLFRMNVDGSELQNLTHNQYNMNRSPVYTASGRILFTSDRGGNTDVWSMSTDGYDLLPVIDSPAYDSTY